jgi:hypothetical protein
MVKSRMFHVFLLHVCSGIFWSLTTTLQLQIVGVLRDVIFVSIRDVPYMVTGSSVNVYKQNHVYILIKHFDR